MDPNLESIFQPMPQSTVLGQTNGVSGVGHSNLPAACALCQRVLSPDNESGDLEAINICGDCKFLFLEDFESPTQGTRRRRISRVRRARFSSSESIEDVFSHQFSHMINLARHNQPNFSENGNQSVDDDDGSARLQQRSSSRTTPSGSRRWRRVISDTESDGFDSLYGGESESNASFGGYRLFPGESDTISYSAYGGESDVSVDARSFLDTEILGDLDSDTDIDPMHTGLNQWNLDDQEEEEEDSEWEEADAVESTVDNSRGGSRRISSSNERSGLVNWRRQFHSPEFEGGVRYNSDIFHHFEESELANYVDDDYDVQGRRFEELFAQLAGTDSSGRRGAPPAAVSCVNNLPRMVINEKQHDGLTCAICKDFMSVGTVVNQLPCCHLYHPSCILPWLSARNTCPLCRYELPTDDKEYEERKRNTTTSNPLRIHEIEQEGQSDNSTSDSSSDNDDEVDETLRNSESASRETPRGRWLLFAAAPIVSLVGIALVLWLGNPLAESRRRQQMAPSLSSCLPNQRENRSSRRWWSLF